MVLFRESYVYFARFACVLADQLLFEVADEGMGTDRQIVVGALAPSKATPSMKPS